MPQATSEAPRGQLSGLSHSGPLMTARVSHHGNDQTLSDWPSLEPGHLHAWTRADDSFGGIALCA